MSLTWKSSSCKVLWLSFWPFCRQRQKLSSVRPTVACLLHPSISASLVIFPLCTFVSSYKDTVAPGDRLVLLLTYVCKDPVSNDIIYVHQGSGLRESEIVQPTADSDGFPAFLSSHQMPVTGSSHGPRFCWFPNCRASHRAPSADQANPGRSEVNHGLWCYAVRRRGLCSEPSMS